jgi:thioesterase domain-containing protein
MDPMLEHALPPPKFVLVGWSLGSRTACHIAAQLLCLGIAATPVLILYDLRCSIPTRVCSEGPQSLGQVLV